MGRSKRTSPFMSPVAGDVVRSTQSGITRTVIGTVRDDIDYMVDSMSEFTPTKRTCTRASWACWCTRNRAELVTGGPGR